MKAQHPLRTMVKSNTLGLVGKQAIVSKQVIFFLSGNTHLPALREYRIVHCYNAIIHGSSYMS